MYLIRRERMLLYLRNIHVAARRGVMGKQLGPYLSYEKHAVLRFWAFAFYFFFSIYFLPTTQDILRKRKLISTHYIEKRHPPSEQVIGERNLKKNARHPFLSCRCVKFDPSDFFQLNCVNELLNFLGLRVNCVKNLPSIF